MCRDKQNGKIMAMKILKKGVIVGKNAIAHTLSENRVLQMTKHPFLVVNKCYNIVNAVILFQSVY